MDELKPCPFCGGEVMLLEGDEARMRNGFFIFCTCCCFESGAYIKAEYIVEKWNRRVTDG